MSNKFKLLHVDNDSDCDNDNDNNDTNITNNSIDTNIGTNANINTNTNTDTNTNINNVKVDAVIDETSIVSSTTSTTTNKIDCKNIIDYKNIINNMTNVNVFDDFTDVHNKKKTKNNKLTNNKTDIVESNIDTNNSPKTLNLQMTTFTSEMIHNNLNSYYKIYVHHMNNSKWNYQDYSHIFKIKQWNDIPIYFNSINEDNLIDYTMFIMKNEISPMWEDSNNRYKCRCQIKVDTIDSGKKLFNKLLVHFANNDILKTPIETIECVNGLVFNPKKIQNHSINSKISYYAIIEIWFKNKFDDRNSVAHKIFNNELSDIFSKYSIRYKNIKPEF